MSGILGQVARAVPAFADGTWEERRGTIGALLLLYGLVEVTLGFHAATWYGLGLAVPGVVGLSLFAPVSEGYGWYVLYAALIVAPAVDCTYSTRRRPVGRTAV